MKKPYEVTILNQKFVLKTDNNEDKVKQVADYVNSVMHNIQKKSQTISTQNIAILGALNIAEELFAFEDDMKDMVADWKQKLLEVLPTD